MYTYDNDAEELASSDLGTDQSDQGGVGGSERVFALQDAEFEHESAEGLIEHIDQAGDDMVSVLETHAMVVESIGSNNKAQMTAALAKARGLRRHLSSRYGSHGCSLPVVESIHVPVATVFALEEEAEEEVGFLRRIFRSIANAFKWLWEKLTGVFKKGEKKDEQLEEKSGKVAEEVKNLESNPEKNTSDNITVDLGAGDDAVLSWLGRDGSFASLHRKMEDLDKILKDAGHGVDELKSLGRLIREISEATGSGEQDTVDTITVSFNEKVANIVSRWPLLDKKVLNESDGSGREIASVRGFDQLPTGKGYAVVSYREKDQSSWIGVAVKGSFIALNRTIKAAKIEDLIKGLEIGVKVQKSVSELSSKVDSINSLQRDIDIAIKGLLDQKYPEDKEELRAMKRNIVSNFKPMMNLIGALSLFYATLPIEGRTAAMFTLRYVGLSAEARSGKEQTTTDEKKE